MFRLFRSADDTGDEVDEAARRNEEAFQDLKAALRRLLAERNQPGRVSGEHTQ